LVTVDCGRLLALATSPEKPNAFWTSPLVFQPTIPVANIPGGMGGERLWIGPELAYFWNGVPDWSGFSNYQKQLDIDPGAHRIVEDGSTVVELHSSMALKSYTDGASPSLHVRRRIEITSPPFNHPGLLSAAVRLTHECRFAAETAEGIVDVWQILQVPTGSRMLAPLRAAEEPLPYGKRGGWVVEPNAVRWSFTGTESAKMGVSTRASTGLAAALVPQEDGEAQLVVRSFEAHHALSYADHPHGIPREDQVFQAWDGFGFGELEVRSPALDARFQRSLLTENEIWVFSGAMEAINELGLTAFGMRVS
jgi:hypothetical protein